MIGSDTCEKAKMRARLDATLWLSLIALLTAALKNESRSDAPLLLPLRAGSILLQRYAHEMMALLYEGIEPTRGQQRARGDRAKEPFRV